MERETRVTLRFSRREVVEALKQVYPKSLAVAAIPAAASSTNTVPTLSADGDHLTITWTRLGEPT